MDNKNIVFQRFKREHYPDYLAWFEDSELNERLGPMVEDWLTAILEMPEDKGITWAVLLASELVGVIETVFSPNMPCGITAIAVKPSRRSKGIGRMMLRKLIADYVEKGVSAFIAYVHQTNKAAAALLLREGFMVVSEPDDKGYIEYCRY